MASRDFEISLNGMSVELHLSITSFLDLSSLINIRRTSRYWHKFITDSLGARGVLTPSRAKLLNLYLQLHKSKAFLASRKYILPHIRPFDRQDYVTSLARRISNMEGAALPPEFETWILEWPERAVIGWSWPGLDGEFDADVCPRNSKTFGLLEAGDETWWRTYGANLLHPARSLGFATQHAQWPARLEVQDHGFGLRTDLMLMTGTLHDGQVWCECLVEDDGSGSGKPIDGILEDWTAWLRRELLTIEFQYSPKRKIDDRLWEADMYQYLYNGSHTE